MCKAIFSPSYLLHFCAQKYTFGNKIYLLWVWRDFKKKIVVYVHMRNETLSQTFHLCSILTG